MAFLLSVIMLLLVPLATVNAIEYEEEIYTEISAPQNGLPVSNGVSNNIEQFLGNKYGAFKEYLRKELVDCNETIDISSYNIPNTDANRQALGNIVWNEFPEAFHVSGSLGFSGTSAKIYYLKLEYTYTESQYTKMYNETEKVVTELLSGIKGNASLTDVQKALLIHDRIAVLCEYDTSSVIPDNSVSYTMYGTLVKEIAVCQGYSEAYKYLLEKVGIESYLCSSEEMHHAWNIVKIGGKYYHVDVTWDDPTQDIIGRVKHTYFLLSTNALKTVNKGAHNASDFDTTPVSTTYDNYFWDNSDTEFQLIGNSLYYIDNSDEYLKTYSGNKLCSVRDTWYASGSGFWVGNFSRLSSDGTDLLFTETDAVYRYSLSNGKTEKVFTTENSYGKGYNIYGFKYDDGKLICEIRNTPNETNNRYIVTGSYSSVPVTYTVSYNANGGSVSPASVEVKSGSSVILPTPTRNGYTCLGWSESKNADVAKYEPGDSITVTKDIALYAVWEEDKAGFTVKTFDTVTNDNFVTTVEIFEEGSDVALHKFEIGDSGEQKIELSEMEKGSYIVVISKKNHVTKTCEVTIDTEHPGFELQINPVGDGTGDGKVNAIDVARANASAKGVSPVYGYEMDCYDINGDNKINAIDVAKINAHAKGVKSLW